MLKDEQAKTFTVPVTRRYGKAPVTQTQKILFEHRREKILKEMNLPGMENHMGPLTAEHHAMLQQATLNLTNNNNLQYVGPVFIGTPLQGSADSMFVYDTGSGYLTVSTAGCTSCSSIYYNPSLSSTAATSSYTT